MKLFVAAIAVVASLTLSSANAEPGQPTASTLSVRVQPIGDSKQRRQLWNAIDKISRPTTITVRPGQTVPDAVRQVCGSAPQDLLDVILQKNPRASLLAQPEERQLAFIPCPYWYFGDNSKLPTISVHAGDKLAELMPLYMGANGPASIGTVKELNPGVIDKDGIVLRTGPLRVPYIVHAVHIPLPAPIPTSAALTAARPVLSVLPESSKGVALQRGPQLSDGAYSIVEEVSPDVNDPQLDCGAPVGVDVWPFDVAAIAKGFGALTESSGAPVKTGLVLVADTGLDVSKPALELTPVLNGALWTNPRMASGIATGTQSFKSDLHGASMVTRTGLIAPTLNYQYAGHGTQVTTIFLAQSKGIPTNVTPRIAVAKLNDEQAPFSIGLNSIPEAFGYASAIDATVVSLSVVIKAKVNGLKDGLQNPKYVIVVAAGNDGMPLDQLALYPPAMDSPYRAKLLVVGAHDWKNHLTPFSNYGELVDILAPGCAIPIKDSDNNVSYVSGTSYAAPFVASTAALLAASNLGPDEIKTRIVVSGDFDAELAQKVRYAVRLNVERAIRLRDDSIVLDGQDEPSRHPLFGELQDGQTWTCKATNEDRAFNPQQVYKIVPRFPISTKQSVFRVLARLPDSADVSEVNCDEPFAEPVQFKGPNDSDFRSYDWSQIIELVPRWEARR